MRFPPRYYRRRLMFAYALMSSFTRQAEILHAYMPTRAHSAAATIALRVLMRRCFDAIFITTRAPRVLERYVMPARVFMMSSATRCLQDTRA